MCAIIKVMENFTETELSDYKRIVIVGCGGSGKSFLARKLSSALGYKIMHLDKEFWLPLWEHVTYEVFANKQRDFISNESWIIEGNYHSSMEMRFAFADLVIFLDINRLVCLYSVIRRLKQKRPDLPEGLKNTLDAEFLKWIWNFSKNEKPKIIKLHNKYMDTPFITITSRKKLKELIAKA